MLFAVKISKIKLHKEIEPVHTRAVLLTTSHYISPYKSSSTSHQVQVSFTISRTTIPTQGILGEVITTNTQVSSAAKVHSHVFY